MRKLLSFLLVALSLSAFADPVSEYQLKAGYAYNFASYTEWPESGRVNFNFCTLNDDNVGLALRRYEGRPIHGRRLVVARLTSLVAINQCQVLYIGASEIDNMPRILHQLGDEPILTISDSAAATGACVKLALDGEQLVFDLNFGRCQRIGLKPNASLLRLAREVIRP